MINDKIIGLVLYYSECNKLLDKALIENLVYYIIDNGDYITQEKFKKVIFIQDDNEAAFSVIVSLGIIYINYPKIIENATYCLNLGKSMAYINFDVVLGILHEIQHLKEEYKGKINLKDYKILRLGEYGFTHNVIVRDTRNKLNVIDKFKMKVQGKNYFYDKVSKLEKGFYHRLYYNNPSERIAEIDAHRILINSFDRYPMFKRKARGLYEELHDDSLNCLSIGYFKTNEGYNVPILDYIDGLGIPRELKRLDDFNMDSMCFDTSIYSKYDYEYRMRYGYPITKKDVSNLKMRLYHK